MLLSLLAAVSVVVWFSFPLPYLGSSVMHISGPSGLPGCCLVACRLCGLGSWFGVGEGGVAIHLGLGACLVLPRASVGFDSIVLPSVDPRQP